MTKARFTVDPADPRAPPIEIWERMSPEERAEVVNALPFVVQEEAERRLEAAERRIAQLEAEIARLKRELLAPPR